MIFLIFVVKAPGREYFAVSTQVPKAQAAFLQKEAKERQRPTKRAHKKETAHKNKDTHTKEKAHKADTKKEHTRHKKETAQ